MEHATARTALGADRRTPLTGWLLQGCWFEPDVYALPLKRCVLDVFIDAGASVVACTRQDLIRVWPLPMETPLWEDAIRMPDGDQARPANGQVF